MTGSATASAVRCLRDPVYWVLLSAGPVLWVIMVWIGGMQLTWAKTLPATALLLVVVVYPVLEEIVFRGALQGYLLGKKFFAKPLMAAIPMLSMANLLTSCVFVGMHFINHPPLAAALVFLPSLVFGWAMERYAHLFAPILLHAFYNAGYFVLFG